jgi:peptide-methionine (S)-S-oxide reductase
MHAILRAVATALAIALPWSALASEKTAVFAGGCFWCVEADFEKLPGVVDAVSGYAGGQTENPTYRQVAAGRTGHLEVVQVRYDAAEISYRALVDHFFRMIDPLDAGGQFCDRGQSYTTAIFVGSAEEREAAEESKAAAGSALGADIVTPIRDAAAFWRAEDEHQDYYRKNAARYAFYRTRCGRDARLKALWGKR